LLTLVYLLLVVVVAWTVHVVHDDSFVSFAPVVMVVDLCCLYSQQWVVAVVSPRTTKKSPCPHQNQNHLDLSMLMAVLLC
jgi:hypothetical protein